MSKTEGMLREGRDRLNRLSGWMRAPSPSFSVLARKRRLAILEARYAEVTRRFEQLRCAGTDGIADLKVGLEKAWAAFRADIGWTP